MRKLNIYSFILALFLSACSNTTTKNKPIQQENNNTIQQENNNTVPRENNNTTPQENNETNVSIHLTINEILASNKNTIQDPNFQKYSDYIELYNDDNKSIDISGFGMSDKDAGDIWRFPASTTIAGKGFLLVWADKKDTALHSNFKLSADGEQVILYDKDNNIIDKFVFAKQYEDIAIGKKINGDIIYLQPTPNQDNNETENELDPSIDSNSSGDVYINELMASNTYTAMNDDFTDFSDWIELYNSSNQDKNISGYKLSDDPDKTDWSIPNDTIIPAKGYMIFWADKKETKRHTNFSLSSKGEELLLYNSNGQLIDSVTFPKQQGDISYGRHKDSKLWGYMEPSFAQKNSHWHSDSNRTDPSTLSHEGGFYDSNITVSITQDSADEIYFTLDGSTPSRSSTPYTNPLNIRQTTVLKTISYQNTLLPSKVNTNTYFISVDSILPIVSISMNSDYLYDDMYGIYTDGTNGISKMSCGEGSEPKNFLQAWERPSVVEYYDENKNSIFSIGLDIEISGQCSRFHPKKHLSFETNSKYGQKSIKYTFYPTKPQVDKVKDFKLRGGEGGFMLRDLLSVMLTESGILDIDYQAYKAVRMFMNGEYWGVYNIREKKGKDYLKSNYPDIDEKNLDIIGNGIKSGDKIEYNNLHTYIQEHNLSIEANYQHILTRIDEANFIDYMIIMTYSGNSDWGENNFRVWRERKTDEKWRWMLDDLDYGFIRPSYNTFDIATRPGMMMTDLFIGLLKNETFKNKFINRYNTLLDTLFSAQNVLQQIDILVDERRIYMNLEDKWGINLSRFDNDVQRIRDFATARVPEVRAQLGDL